MMSTDAQYDKAAKRANRIAKVSGKPSRIQFDSETKLTDTLILYFDGIDQCVGVAVEMKANKIVKSWTY